MKSGALGGTNKQAVVSTAPTKSVINVSRNSNPLLPSPTVGIQVKDEAMMLKDAASVSMIMGYDGTIVDKNKRENTNALGLSTRDESSDLSLGEKVRATVENLPNAFGKAGPTHVEILSRLTSR